MYEEAQRMLIDTNAIYTLSTNRQFNVAYNYVKGLEFRPDMQIRYDLLDIEK